MGHSANTIMESATTVSMEEVMTTRSSNYCADTANLQATLGRFDRNVVSGVLTRLAPERHALAPQPYQLPASRPVQKEKLT